MQKSMEIQLELLEEVHEFCENNNLIYYLMFGTLIGAVRHKGFIPWDDDVDICMPRKDYDLFFANYNEIALRKHSKAVNCNNDNKYYYPFGKVIDTRTVLMEDVCTDYSLGVYIDVFPLDNLSNNESVNAKARKKLHLLRNLLASKMLPNSNRRKGAKKIIHRFLNKVLFRLDMNYISKKMDTIARNVAPLENDTLQYGIIADVDAKGMDRNYVGYMFKDRKLVPFEQYSFFVPGGYDGILTQIYGDYMTPPPEHKRHSLHVYKQYWKE